MYKQYMEGLKTPRTQIHTAGALYITASETVFLATVKEKIDIYEARRQLLPVQIASGF
jgi:hypothetical protein